MLLNYSSVFISLPNTVFWFFTGVCVWIAIMYIEMLNKLYFQYAGIVSPSARLVAVPSHLNDDTGRESVLCRLALFICLVMKSLLAEQWAVMPSLLTRTLGALALLHSGKLQKHMEIKICIQCLQCLVSSPSWEITSDVAKVDVWMSV